MQINMKQKIIKNLILFFLLVTTSLLSSSCSKNVEPTTVSGFKFNTYISITAYSKVDSSVLDKCLDLCDTYENLYSRTIANSTLSKMNNHEITEIPAELAALIQYGIQYGDLSNGTFDITIGSVSSLWDFTSDNPQVPNSSDIQEELLYVNYKNISLQKKPGSDDTYLISIPTGTIIDLGAIAKGYIADKLKDYLLDNGVTSALINLGGNILCVGNKPNDTAFNIGVKKPFSESGESLVTLKITDKSIVSSGTYERCFTKDGHFYHHILDPRTGYPYDNQLTSVTIISDSSVQGDCLSTTCFTLGLDKGLKLVESLDGIEAIFVTSDNQIHYSSGASKYIVAP